MTEPILLCPVCRAVLVRTEGGYRCQAGHNFDRARQGYTNLLTGRAAGQHGDNADMIRARRDFLNGGYYAPLRDALCRLAEALFPAEGTLIDAGCGECYYTDGVMNALSEKHARGIGLDISREALRAAGARQSVREGALTLFAAGVYDMPLRDGCADMVLNLFAPLADAEYRRVLKPDGVLLMAIPAARHLWELKELLYDTPYENQVRDFRLPGFALLSSQKIIAPFTLTDRESVRALFSMTPYCYRTPAAGRARLEACERLSVTAEFHLLAYRLADEKSVSAEP